MKLIAVWDPTDICNSKLSNGAKTPKRTNTSSVQLVALFILMIIHDKCFHLIGRTVIVPASCCVFSIVTCEINILIKIS